MPSVGISPGPTALSRMPYCAHSTASDLVITSMPALLIADGTTYGLPLSTQVVMMLITLRYGWPGCHCARLRLARPSVCRPPA